MKKSKLIDKIIKEPLGGAHYDRAATFEAVKAEILKTFKTLQSNVACAEFGENWPSGSEKKISNCCPCIFEVIV